MKNLSLILNAILLVAVGVLYFLHFSTKTTPVAAPDKKTAPATTNETTRLPIAYVNSDSLLINYDYYKNTKKELEEKRKKLETEINGRARAYENEVVAYQQKGRNMTLEQAQLTEQNLMKKQQDLMQYRDRISQSLAVEEQQKNEELISNISKYLEKYNEGKPYKYILGYTKGGDLWFADDSLEITNEVLQGLNKEYNANKANTQPAAANNK